METFILFSGFFFSHSPSTLQISTGKQNKLKELIETKAAALNRANKQIDKIEKEKSVLRSDVQNLTVSMQHMRTEVEEKSHEINALLKSFNDAEKKSEKLSKQLEAIQKEKDLTGFELVKRNEDVGNLNEKLSIMQIALDRGMCGNYSEKQKQMFIQLAKQSR